MKLPSLKIKVYMKMIFIHTILFKSLSKWKSTFSISVKWKEHTDDFVKCFGWLHNWALSISRWMVWQIYWWLLREHDVLRDLLFLTFFIVKNLNFLVVNVYSKTKIKYSKIHLPLLFKIDIKTAFEHHDKKEVKDYEK